MTCMGPFVAVAVVGLGLMLSQRSVTSPFGLAGATALGADSTLTVTSIIISGIYGGAFGLGITGAHSLHIHGIDCCCHRTVASPPSVQSASQDRWRGQI